MDTYNHVTKNWLQPVDFIPVAKMVRNIALMSGTTEDNGYAILQIDMNSGKFAVSGTRRDSGHLTFSNTEFNVPSTTKFAVILDIDAKQKFWGRWDINESYFTNLSLIIRNRSGNRYKVDSYHPTIENALDVLGHSFEGA